MRQSMQTQQNRINSYVIGHPIGETKAERMRKRLMKNICNSFQPFNQYFQQFAVQFLVEPKPTLIQKQQNATKYQFSIAKQLEYVRGSTKNYIDEQHLQKMLTQDMQDRGLLQNHKNKSIIFGNLVIIAHGCFLKSAILQQNEQEACNQVKLVYHQFPQPILQIGVLSLKIIIVRCRYWIFIFDCVHNLIKAQKRFNQQITAFQIFINSVDQILISTYDQKFYRIYHWNLSNNNLCLNKCQQSFWGVHSIISINCRQFVLGLANKIIIQDLRNNQVETLKRVTQLGNDRFVSLASIPNTPFQFVLAKSRYIEIFQLRRPELSLLSIPHYCEQSPPSCLLTFNWATSYLIAYSPSLYGSTLLINIGETPLKGKSKQQEIFAQTRLPPMLLFDAGKIYQGLYSISVSAVVEGNNLKIFHFDGSQGICLQAFKKQVNGRHSIRRIKPLIKNDYPEQPYKKWIKYKNIQPFLSREPRIQKNIQSEQSEQNDGESEIFSNKINYCSLDKFHNRISQISKIEDNDIKKLNDIPETYFSQTLQPSQDQNWVDVIRYSKQQKKQPIITEQLIDYIQSQWKL